MVIACGVAGSPMQVLLDLVHDEVWPIVNSMHQGPDRSLRAMLLRLKDAPPARCASLSLRMG